MTLRSTLIAIRDLVVIIFALGTLALWLSIISDVVR